MVGGLTMFHFGWLEKGNIDLRIDKIKFEIDFNEDRSLRNDFEDLADAGP